MGLPKSLTMRILLIWVFWLTHLKTDQSQSENGSSSTSPARALDSLLQNYAYKALVRPRTGISYDGIVPSNLSGIKISAMRLRSGSLRTKGVKKYKEFEIAAGLIVDPYVERIVLVYHNLGNWSHHFYPSLPGYTYLTPTLGLLAYDASNLSASNLPELDIRVLGSPMSISFTQLKSVPDVGVAKCVQFDLEGSAKFSNVTSGSMCYTTEQGHFSIVVESVALPPSPAQKKKKNSRLWVIIGCVVGVVLLFGLVASLTLLLQKCEKRKKMKQMEKATEVGETLNMTSVGDTKAPAAMVTRTQPVLETEYAP